MRLQIFLILIFFNTNKLKLVEFFKVVSIKCKIGIIRKVFKRMEQLKRRNFELDTEQNYQAVVICSTPMCGACRMQCAYIEKEFEPKYCDSTKFFKYDISEDIEDISAKYDITGVPTTLFFKEGKLVMKHNGLMKPDQFKDAMKKLEKTKDSDNVSE